MSVCMNWDFFPLGIGSYIGFHKTTILHKPRKSRRDVQRSKGLPGVRGENSSAACFPPVPRPTGRGLWDLQRLCLVEHIGRMPITLGGHNVGSRFDAVVNLCKRRSKKFLLFNKNNLTTFVFHQQLTPDQWTSKAFCWYSLLNAILVQGPKTLALVNNWQQFWPQVKTLGGKQRAQHEQFEIILWIFIN